MTYECWPPQGGGWQPCVSGVQYGPLADFPDYEFSVRAIDHVGNRGAAASRKFSVDTVAPDVTITSGPTGSFIPSTVEFSFTSSDASATFICEMDHTSKETCVSPWQSGTLDFGSHTFTVEAVDAAGNSNTASWTFSVGTR